MRKTTDMDLMTIIGFFAGAATVYYVMADGNILNMIINPVAFVLVFGGTFSATLIAYPWAIIRHVFPSLRTMFIIQHNDDSSRLELIEKLGKIAEKARRQSIESLQEDIPDIEDPFMAGGLQMVVDGLEYDVVKDNMEKEILFARQHSRKVSSVFRTMATMSPIFGLLGTLIGVVQVLRNLSDPSTMGEAMAIAITTTFYGIFAANFLFLPAAIKLSEHSENIVMNRQLVSEGILAIQQGDPPLMVRKKLNSFLLSHLRTEGSGSGKKD